MKSKSELEWHQNAFKYHSCRDKGDFFVAVDLSKKDHHETHFERPGRGLRVLFMSHEGNHLHRISFRTRNLRIRRHFQVPNCRYLLWFDGVIFGIYEKIDLWDKKYASRLFRFQRFLWVPNEFDQDWVLEWSFDFCWNCFCFQRKISKK